MKKLKVLTDQCIGCGACVGIDPEHFDFNEDGLSKVISEENLQSEAIQDAIESCPVGIISIEEDSENDEEQHTSNSTVQTNDISQSTSTKTESQISNNSVEEKPKTCE